LTRFGRARAASVLNYALGHVVATPGALAAIEKSGQQPVDFLARHVTVRLFESVKKHSGAVSQSF